MKFKQIAYIKLYSKLMMIELIIFQQNNLLQNYFLLRFRILEK